MAQIVTTKAHSDRCNLAAIRNGGSKVAEVLAINEVWLVDTTNADKGNEGYGKYDSYIIGDGVHTASELSIFPIDVTYDFDEQPTINSNNLVTSGGIKTALDDKADAANVYTKVDTYSKEELSGIIEATATSIVVTTSEGLPSTGSEGIIYRVAGTTSYTDQAWNGTQYITLATYDYGGGTLINITEELDGKTVTQKEVLIPNANVLGEILNGEIQPVLIKEGYRLLYSSDTNKGYYYETASQAVYIYDVTAFQGEKVKITRKRVVNSYSYAFVTDYTQIPSSKDLTTWDSIFISGTRSNTEDSELLTSSLNVPNDNYEHVYVCVTCNKAAGCSGYYEPNGLNTKIAAKQDLLTFDTTPKENSLNPVTSGGIYQAAKPIIGISGIQDSIFTKEGYRLVYTNNVRGYYYSQSSASVVTYDVTSLQGKKISCKQTRQANAYAYAFVTDYTQIPTAYDLDTWDSIYVSGLRENTDATSTYITRTITVPSNSYEHLYLCVTQINAYPVEVVDLESVVPPLTLEELQNLREQTPKIAYVSGKIGIPKISEIKYDYNIIIGYGQSLAAGSGFQAEDLPQDSNALMFYLRFSSTDSMITTKNLETIKCTGNTSSVQDFPPNASATIDFAKLYRLKTGDTSKKFVHICPAIGSMTIAQLMDFKRYKTHEVQGAGDFDFPNLDTGYATVRPYYAFQRMLTRIKTIADSENKTVGVIAVNWNQGEADYGSQSGTAATTTEGCSCNANADEYKARLRALHDDMWTDMQSILGQTEEPAWFIAQCSGQFVKSTFNINQALIDICDGKKYFETYSTYPVPNKDDGHPTGNGYRWYGEYLAKAMADVLLRNNNPELIKVKRIDAATNSVKVYCSVPVPPLRFETKTLAEMKNMGFVLRTSTDSNIAIANVKISNDVIIITPGTNLTVGNTISVQYGTANSTGQTISGVCAAGNVCDSDRYNANFMCMNDVTSAVEYVPLDEDGTPLEGKQYPLYNFLQPFKADVVIQ